MREIASVIGRRLNVPVVSTGDSTKPPNEIWILGATGRIGSAVARDLVRRGLRPTLLKRDEARLRDWRAPSLESRRLSSPKPSKL